MKLRDLAEKFSGKEMFNVYEKPVVDPDSTETTEVPDNTKIAIFTKETYPNIDEAILDREVDTYYVSRTYTSFTIEVILTEVSA